ncbi:hypothetical protein [Dactylosporangium sp. CA-092794]|uniref:hypothetical protein n=1 Tax=Dactylosporangium sp. CA-092794 TaxID=3239929 RepID=UPI003D8D16E8
MRCRKGLAVLVASALFAGGCADNKDTGAAGGGVTPGPSRSVSAGEQLAAAAAKSGSGSYHFAVSDPAIDGGVEGAADPATQTMTGKMTLRLDADTTMTIESLTVAGTFYLKITGLPLPVDLSKYWFRADPARLGSEFTTLDAKDPAGLNALVKGATAVQNVDGTLFTGTLDITQDTSGMLYDADMVKELGDKAKAVPFAASIDQQGYLNSIKLSLPAYGTEPASETTITLSDFGRPVPATAPTGDQVRDLPDSAYKALNGG